MSNHERVRVLHVLGGLNRGGIETWLMHILRNIDRNKFQMDFLVHSRSPCAYDEEARSLGARVIPCMDAHRPWEYVFNFRRVLRQFGPYHVVHSHVQFYSGLVLTLAKSIGIPVRIAHGHNDMPPKKGLRRLVQPLYVRVGRKLISMNATSGLAASDLAAACLFGVDWKSDNRWHRHFYSIDVNPFRRPVDCQLARAQLGIPITARVIGHVGRFVEQKNHLFVLSVAQQVVARDPTAVFLLVGDGPLRPKILEEIGIRGLKDRCVCIPASEDIPGLMRGVMDVFILPSLFEGLPVALLEAQAAGLSCVISDAIAPEASVVGPLVRRLSLQDSASIWADAILEARNWKEPVDHEQALSCITSTSFDIEQGVRRMEEIYVS
jgi:glycosyltransferase involved in cell wall biosynthesis